MLLDEQQIKTFQTLWENRFKQKISKDDAYSKGVKLIRLVELIYKPISETEYKQLQERRKETGDL